MTQGMVRAVLSGSMRGLAAVALVVAAGGCTGPDPVDPVPTTPPATTVPELEPEPTAEQPEEPVAPVPASGTPDERDAEAAGEFFVRLYVHVLQTGDIAQWRERSDPECGFCSNVMSMAEDNAAERAHFADVSITAEPAAFVAFDSTIRVFAVEVPYASAPMEIVGEDGSTIRSFDSDEGYLLMDIAYEPGGGWQLLTGGNHKESHL